MKLRLEADPEELREKSTDLLKSLRDGLADVAPEVADYLSKALPPKERALKYPVLRDLEKKTSAEYDRTLKRMVRAIGKVLDRGPVAKSEEPADLVFVNDPTDLTKGWYCAACGAVSPGERCEHVQRVEKSLHKALYIGPRGGKWADPDHTIPWDAKKHGKQVGLALTPTAEKRPKPVVTEPPAKPEEPKVWDIIKNDPALTKEQKEKKQSEALKSIQNAVRQGAAASLDEWDLPAGARIEDPWEPKIPPPDQKWEHPDYGAGVGVAPWQEPDWSPDFHKYDYIMINSSAGKDSQAMLTRIVKLADEQGYLRDKLIVVHADLGRVEWEGTLQLAKEQAEHYGLRFEVVQRQQNDLVDQIEERYWTQFQRNEDVAVLAESGIRTWKDLHEASAEDIVKVIGEAKGKSKWDGNKRAYDMVRDAKKKRDAKAKKHFKKMKSKESAEKNQQARVDKATMRLDAAKTDKQREKAEESLGKAQAKLDQIQAELKDLRDLGDPWDWPIDYGEPIPWPSSDARFCTSDHKTVEVDKLITALAKEFKEGSKDDRPLKVLNALGIRAQESDNREKMDNFGKQKATRNQDIDRWYPIHQWSEKEVWEEIAESGVPFHKAYALGMRRLSCVFCVYANKEDLMIAAVNNPDLFETYLELEEKVGSDFKKGQPLAEIAAEIKRRRDEGYELNDMAEWVKKALEALGIEADDDLIKAAIDSDDIEGGLTHLVLTAALKRLRRHGQEVGAVTIEWKVTGACIHLDTAVDSHHVEFVDYPQAYNASMMAAVFAQLHGLAFEEHNAPGPMPEDALERSLDAQEGFWDADWTELPENAGEALWDELVKARGHKYVRRVPYTDAKGRKRYRYYYRESAAARAAREGETARLGEKLVKVLKIESSGDMVLQEGENEPYRVTASAWAEKLADHYGEQFYLHAEKRARQAISAVLRLVPGRMLEDLRGKTDAERLKDLKQRVPEVYDRLQASFQRAGVNAFQAKQILGNLLKREGWKSDARALVVGAVLTPEGARLARKHRQVMDAAENLAGGDLVDAEHAAVVIDLVQANVQDTAKRAERELVKLQKALQEAWDRPGDLERKAAVLAQAMASTAMQKLQALATAFPGLADKAVPVVRDTLLEVASVAPKPPKREGAEAAVFVAGEGGKPKALKAKYKLVEAAEVVPSHDPTSFKANKDYPKDVQERAYHRDKAEQLKVVRNAGTLNPAFVVNTNPDAVNGPPLVTDDGVVLGGNSRTMSMQLAYHEDSEKAAEMKAYLEAHAYEVGLQPEDVAAMKQPILVRVVEVEDKSTENLQVLVRQMNESFTQGMDPRTMQVALGRRLDDNALQALAKNMEEGETLNHFLGTARSDAFMGALRRAGVIDDRNVNQFVKRGTKRLNSDGKVLVARVLAGRVLADADLLSETSPKLVESIAGAVPAMVQATGSGPGYDLSESVRIALDAFNKLQDRVEAGAMKPLDAKISDREMQSIMENQFNDLFGEVHPVLGDPRAQAMLELFIRRPGPKQMRAVFKEYAALAAANPEGQAQLLGEKLLPDQVFRLSIQATIDKEAKAEAEAQAKKPKAAPGLFDKSEDDMEWVLEKAEQGDLFGGKKPAHGDKVVAVGPKGGKIYGYDAKGKPIYTPKSKGEKKPPKPQAEEHVVKQNWKIVRVRDLRPIDWDSGERIPLDPADAPECDRCGRKHQVVYEMQSEDGKHAALVGSGCGPKLAGGAEYIDKVSLREAKKKYEEQVRSKAQEKADQWVDELFTQHLAELKAPGFVYKPKTKSPYDEPFAQLGDEPRPVDMVETDDGLAQVWMFSSSYQTPGTTREEELKRNAAMQWVDSKVADVMAQFAQHIPEKWKWVVGKETVFATQRPRHYVKQKLEARLRAALFSGLYKASDPAEPLENDHTKRIHDRDDRRYTRVKQALQRRGYVEADFEEGGPLHGWSVNELIDLARDKRID